jgi:hypothetical protein
MKISRIVFSMVATAALVLSTTPAHAASADKGTWDSSDAYADCGAGVNSRTCYYDLYSNQCSEASTVGVTVAPCWFELHVSVNVVPILNAAGKVVGCTSSALSAQGYGYYDSTFNQFDNSNMSDTLVFEVKDTFADGNPGVAKYTIVDRDLDGTRIWTATGSFVTTCARNVWQYNSGGAGSVTVEV